jgi:hypothetical protein
MEEIPPGYHFETPDISPGPVQGFFQDGKKPVPEIVMSL